MDLDKNQKLNYIWNAIGKAYPSRALVFNDGSPNARIMIIGEAPGADEERQGLPFVGRAGQLLNRTLEALGWERSDFYITNVVKYRPVDPATGSNRTPTDDEIAKFRQSIEKEISVVNPKLIVLLGRVAMAGIGYNGSMGEYRGKVLEREIPESSLLNQGVKRKILITYHPAAILRNPNWEPQFRSDLAKMRELI